MWGLLTPHKYYVYSFVPLSRSDVYFVRACQGQMGHLQKYGYANCKIYLISHLIFSYLMAITESFFYLVDRS